MVAKKENIDFNTAIKIVQKEYDKVGENNNKWYDINYWIEFFQLGIDYETLLLKYENRIKVFPEVPKILEQLSSDYRLICISAMPREFLKPKIKKLEKYFHSTFSTLSDYQQLKNREVYIEICKKLKMMPEKILHIGDHEKSDYIAAKEAGMHALLVDRYQFGYHNKYNRDVVQSLAEIIKKIDQIE